MLTTFYNANFYYLHMLYCQLLENIAIRWVPTFNITHMCRLYSLQLISNGHVE
jgi:hypothetical protein